MGFIFSRDGECIVCKRISNKFCDACGRYVCDAHQILIEIPRTYVKHIYCKECYEKGKKPINFTSVGRNPHHGV